MNSWITQNKLNFQTSFFLYPTCISVLQSNCFGETENNYLLCFLHLSVTAVKLKAKSPPSCNSVPHFLSQQNKAVERICTECNALVEFMKIHCPSMSSYFCFVSDYSCVPLDWEVLPLSLSSFATILLPCLMVKIGLGFYFFAQKLLSL